MLITGWLEELSSKSSDAEIDLNADIFLAANSTGSFFIWAFIPNMSQITSWVLSPVILIFIETAPRISIRLWFTTRQLIWSVFGTSVTLGFSAVSESCILLLKVIFWQMHCRVLLCSEQYSIFISAWSSYETVSPFMLYERTDGTIQHFTSLKISGK